MSDCRTTTARSAWRMRSGSTACSSDDDEDAVRHEDEFDMLKHQMCEDGTYYE